MAGLRMAASADGLSADPRRGAGGRSEQRGLHVGAKPPPKRQKGGVDGEPARSTVRSECSAAAPASSERGRDLPPAAVASARAAPRAAALRVLRAF